MTKKDNSYSKIKENQNIENETLRNQILERILTYVSFDGWSDKALQASCKDLDINPVYCLTLFPLGMEDILLHFGKWADEKMLLKLESIDKTKLKIRERIAIAVKSRFECLAPHREAVRRGSAFLANPLHLSAGMKMLYRTVDEIWYWAGDQSTDFNFYTKRGLLAGVHTSTLLYWLADESESFSESWIFLGNRIDNVLKIGKTIQSMKDFCKDTNCFVFQK